MSYSRQDVLDKLERFTLTNWRDSPNGKFKYKASIEIYDNKVFNIIYIDNYNKYIIYVNDNISPGYERDYYIENDELKYIEKDSFTIYTELEYKDDIDLDKNLYENNLLELSDTKVRSSVFCSRDYSKAIIRQYLYTLQESEGTYLDSEIVRTFNVKNYFKIDGTNQSFYFTINDGYISYEQYNKIPTINGKRSRNTVFNPYEIYWNFIYNFKVDDADTDDILTIKEYIDNELIYTINNAVRNKQYTFSFPEGKFNQLEKDSEHTVTISVSDGKCETTNNYKFVKTNNVPEITIIKDIESKIFSDTGPEITYKATDTDNDKMYQYIYVNDILIEDKKEITADTEIILQFTHDEWIRIPNGRNKITLQIVDEKGGKGFKYFYFNKNETVIDFEFKKPIETPVSLLKYYHTTICNNVEDIKIYVTNNGFDETPVWEEMTTNPHNFKNNTKTADKWGFNLRIVAKRTTETDDMNIYGIGGSFI